MKHSILEKLRRLFFPFIYLFFIFGRWDLRALGFALSPSLPHPPQLLISLNILPSLTIFCLVSYKLVGLESWQLRDSVKYNTESLMVYVKHWNRLQNVHGFDSLGCLFVLSLYICITLWTCSGLKMINNTTINNQII